MSLNLSRYEDSVVYTRWLFLRGLGIVSFLSFLSYLLQYRGLIGEDGLTPWTHFTRRVSQLQGWEVYLRFPSLAWWFPTDTGLFVLGVLGLITSGLLVLNYLPTCSIFLTWVLYLSLVVTGQQFMAYQWNQLLLEVLFAGLFLAPFSTCPKTVTIPSWISVWYLRFVLFKLYVFSGLAKWGGGESWRNLSAMIYHYETQPLPNPVSWFMYHLPDWVHRVESLGALLIEAVVPVFIFSPRIIRIPVAYLMGGLQLMIMFTGNYGPFNWLALLLCVMLLDDEHLSVLMGLMPSYVLPEKVVTPSGWTWRGDLVGIVVLAILNVFILGSWLQVPTPNWFQRTGFYVQSFRTVNPYGLFGVMTKSRSEIIIEGSRDGDTWKEYEFNVKPGRVDRRPGIAIWSLPRLDWRMWFAALKAPERPRWMDRFVIKLLKGSTPIHDHLARNPFPESPPNYLRAWVYEYEFTDWSGGWDTGKWWKRGNRREYIPPVELRDNQLVRVTDPTGVE